MTDRSTVAVIGAGFSGLLTLECREGSGKVVHAIGTMGNVGMRLACMHSLGNGSNLGTTERPHAVAHRVRRHATFRAPVAVLARRLRQG